MLGVISVVVFGTTGTLAVIFGKSKKSDDVRSSPADSSILITPADGSVDQSDTKQSDIELVEKPQDSLEVERGKTLPIQRPESVPGRMVRLRERLAQSGGFGRTVLNVISRGDLSIEDWEEIEDTLIMSDLGIGPTDEIMAHLRTQAKILGSSDSAQLKQVLEEKLIDLVDAGLDRKIKLEQSNENVGKPGVVLMVGVNGAGKTTTVGKLARILVAEDKKVLLGAADTFRAAAADQLQTWGERVGVEVVRSEKENADSAAVAYDSVSAGIAKAVDVVLIDTAGRLQNKKGLMDELGKVKRVVEKQLPITETLLVIDATTGQNGMSQAKVFAEAVNISGVVLTKLDGTAKGGIVVSVQRELGVPVKLVGLGEGADDMAPFIPQEFVKALLK